MLRIVKNWFLKVRGRKILITFQNERFWREEISIFSEEFKVFGFLFICFSFLRPELYYTLSSKPVNELFTQLCSLCNYYCIFMELGVLFVWIWYDQQSWNPVCTVETQRSYWYFLSEVDALASQSFYQVVLFSSDCVRADRHAPGESMDRFWCVIYIHFGLIFMLTQLKNYKFSPFLSSVYLGQCTKAIL